MHAGFLDMLQHAGHEHRVAIGDRIHVNLDGVTQISIDQHWRTAGNHHGFADIGFKLRQRVDNLHGAAAEHIGRAHQHRITDGLRHAHGFFCRTRDAVVRLFQTEFGDQRRKPLTIFGQIDAVRAGAQDRNAGILQRLRQLQRGLAAQLHDHAHKFAVLHFGVEDFQHVLGGQRFEIEPVRRVVIGGHGFGVAVDHDGFIARVIQREAGVAAAIIKFNALADTVRAAAKDDDLARRSRLALAIWLAKAGGFVAGVHVRRFRREFTGAGIDALEHRPHVQRTAGTGHLGLARAGQLGQPRV